MRKFLTLLEFIENNKEKAIKLLGQFNNLKDKFGDITISTLDTMDHFAKEKLASVSFELLETETISIESIRNDLLKIRSENIIYKKAAVLKLGHNDKLNKHEFAMQLLDEKNMPMKNVFIIILRGKLVEDNLHKAFGDKELLILK